MHLVWNVDGYHISSITTNRWNGMQLFITGIGWFSYDDETMHFQWEATVTSSGWYITIIKPSGKSGEYQGDTFNLPLEVVTACKRLTGYSIPFDRKTLITGDDLSNLIVD